MLSIRGVISCLNVSREKPPNPEHPQKRGRLRGTQQCGKHEASDSIVGARLERVHERGQLYFSHDRRKSSELLRMCALNEAKLEGLEFVLTR